MLPDSAALNKLIEALERRGARESGLFAALLRHKDSLLRAMPAGQPPTAARPTLPSCPALGSTPDVALRVAVYALGSANPEGLIDIGVRWC